MILKRDYGGLLRTHFIAYCDKFTFFQPKTLKNIRKINNEKKNPSILSNQIDFSNNSFGFQITTLDFDRQNYLSETNSLDTQINDF